MVGSGSTQDSYPLDKDVWYARELFYAGESEDAINKLEDIISESDNPI